MLCYLFFILVIVSLLNAIGTRTPRVPYMCNRDSCTCTEPIGDARDVPTTNKDLDIDDLDQFKEMAVQISATAPLSVTRIIGGSQTTIENYPYAVQVLYNNQPNCGGSLLTRLHVLSAAHCFVDDAGVLARPRLFGIRVGTTFLNSGGAVHSVSRIIVHERYNHTTHDNDVAVLVLSSKVALSSSVQAALLPEQGYEIADNSTVVVIGWGYTNVAVPSLSLVLNEVSVRTVNRSICQERYDLLSLLTREQHPITDSMMCAGLLDIGGADACQGDSGGPLIYKGLVVGVTSWGYSCARPRFPGVYAKVSVFTTWINETVIRYQNNGYANSHAGIIALLIPLIFAMLSF